MPCKSAEVTDTSQHFIYFNAIPNVPSVKASFASSADVPLRSFSSLREREAVFWLIRLGIFSPFAISPWYVTGQWRQCYIIPHGFTASERDSWELLRVIAPLPSNLFSLQPASLFSSEYGGIWVYYLPPPAPEERRVTQKEGLLPGFESLVLAREPEPPHNSQERILFLNLTTNSFLSGISWLLLEFLQNKALKKCLFLWHLTTFSSLNRIVCFFLIHRAKNPEKTLFRITPCELDPVEKAHQAGQKPRRCVLIMTTLNGYKSFQQLLAHFYQPTKIHDLLLDQSKTNIKVFLLTAQSCWQ